MTEPATRQCGGYTEDDFEPLGTHPVGGDILVGVCYWNLGEEKKVTEVYGRQVHVEGTRYFESPEDVAAGTFNRILKITPTTDDQPEVDRSGPESEKPVSELEDAIREVQEWLSILPDDDLFALSATRIGLRGDEYGEEDSFQDIADRWTLWTYQRFGFELELTPADVADMMQEFKQARRLVRLRSGKTKRDDSVDQTGYIWWRDKKEAQ